MRAETEAIAALAAAALGRQEGALAAVAARLRAFAPRGLVTIARGTSDHAAEYASRLIGRELGLIGASLPPSLVTLARAPLEFRGQLVLGISQSGQSPDVVEAMAAARAGGALTLALVNTPESPLAKAAELVLAADAGPELAVAATKSYVLSLVQLARLTAAWAVNDQLAQALPGLPAALESALATDWQSAVPLLRDAGAAFVVGRGLAYATAREAALKLKETAGLHAEAISAAEIMHGPKALLRPGLPVLVFGGTDLPLAEQAAAAAEIGALTDRLLVAGAVDLGCGRRLVAPAAPHPALQPVVDVTAFYLLADAVSRARGRCPDRPPHLRKVTETR